MREVVKVSPTIEDRYWAKVDRRGVDECWPWTGSTEHFGHGILFVGKDAKGNNVAEKAHRLAWQFHTGNAPGESKVRHRCDNPPCQNYAHLELGTQADNIRDMFERGRARPNHAKPGEGHHAAKLTQAQVDEIRRLRGEGLLQKELAERFGVGRTQISRILNGTRWCA